MNAAWSPSAELADLIEALCHGTITAEETASLEQLVLADPNARRYYVRYLHLHASLPHVLLPQDVKGHECGTTKDELPQSASIHHPSFSIQHSPSPLPPIIIHTLPSPLSSLPSFIGGPLFSYLVAIVIFGIGLMVGATVHVSRPDQYVGPENTTGTPNPRSPIPNPSSIVGRITGMVDCVWEEPRLPSPVHGRGAGGEGGSNSLSSTNSNPSNHRSEITNLKPAISLGDRLALRSGLMEITYNTGAKVILQGPVTYEVESPASGYLSVGKLTAKLEKENLPSPSGRGAGGEGRLTAGNIHRSSFSTQHLFSVRTPTAVVTDLGTEFGVEVGKDGNTTAHVYRGSVRLQANSGDGLREGTAKVLHANESARVEHGGQGNGAPVIRNRLPVEPTAFVRSLPTRVLASLDLVDVVAGGDGFSNKRNRGINSITGQSIAWAMPRSGEPGFQQGGERNFPRGDGHYHPVPEIPFMDGVFVPDGRVRPVQIDSAGHKFGGFINACDYVDRYVWAGGAASDSPPTPSHGVRTQLGDIEYASLGHGYLLLCANNGITFDLAAIRRGKPGL